MAPIVRQRISETLLVAALLAAVFAIVVDWVWVVFAMIPVMLIGYYVDRPSAYRHPGERNESTIYHKEGSDLS